MTGLFAFPKVTWRAVSVWHRNLVVFFRTWHVNFFPPFVDAFLYLFAIGIGLGTYIRQIDGIPYVNFIAPAILAIAIMNSAFFECTYSSYVRMYYQKMFDAMIATPLSIDDVIGGELLWGATRSVIYVTIMLPVLLAFGVVSFPLSLLAIPLAFFGGLLFAVIAMCFTAITPSIETLNYPSFLFITPMTLFAGTFFPLTLLPDFLQYIALALLPLTHLVAVMRMITLDAFSWTIVLHLAWMGVVTVLLWIVSINMMKRRLIV
jgi:lipooligosaccharide transport system permease protein